MGGFTLGSLGAAEYIQIAESSKMKTISAILILITCDIIIEMLDIGWSLRKIFKKNPPSKVIV